MRTGDGKDERHYFSVVRASLLLPLLLLAPCSCKEAARPEPEAVFQQIQQLILEGKLTVAEQQAAAAGNRFAPFSQFWGCKFRLLDAEVLAYQGMYRKSLSLVEDDLPPECRSPDLVIQQGMIAGLAYSRLGRFPEADKSFAQSEELANRTHSVLSGELARWHGSAVFARDDFRSADRLYRKSLEIARRQNDRLLETKDLMNLGSIALNQDHYDDAVTWFNAASEAAQAIHAKEIVVKVLGNLGWAYYKLGDTDHSLALFTEAEQKSGELGFVGDQMKWLNTIGLIYFRRAEYGTAEEYCRRSLELAQRTGNRQGLVDAMTDLAFVFLKESRLDQALQYSDAALRLTREDQDHPAELLPIFAQGQIASREMHDGDARRIFLEVAHDPQSDNDLRWQAEHELARLDEQEHLIPAAEQQYRKAIAILEDARDSLSHEDLKIPFLANASAVYDDYIHFLVAHGKAREALDVAEYSRARTLSEGLGLLHRKSTGQPPGVNVQVAAQRAGCPILFYWLGSRESYLWVITSRSTEFFHMPPAAYLIERVQRYNRVLQSSRDPLGTANDDGRTLFRLLIAPERSLLGDTPRVVIIPDGVLNTLNFEALLDDTGRLHYWIEDATISYASSLRLLSARQAAPAASGGTLLMIGDVSAPSRDYAPLLNAAREIESVSTHFPANHVRMYLRDGATANAYLHSGPDRFAYIHFVAHATASQVSPLDSAIILSRQNAEEDSAKLYAREILKQPLHAKLVTISTCYGASGRSYTGEGLVGLSWAFLRAGAHHVIGALWEVSDTATPQLMGDLYAGLESGRTPEMALRSAKLALVHSASVYRKPYYWAPFQLYTGL